MIFLEPEEVMIMMKVIRTIKATGIMAVGVSSFLMVMITSEMNSANGLRLVELTRAYRSTLSIFFIAMMIMGFGMLLETVKEMEVVEIMESDEDAT